MGAEAERGGQEETRGQDRNRRSPVRVRSARRSGRGAGGRTGEAAAAVRSCCYAGCGWSIVSRTSADESIRYLPLLLLLPALLRRALPPPARLRSGRALRHRALTESVSALLLSPPRTSPRLPSSSAASTESASFALLLLLHPDSTQAAPTARSPLLALCKQSTAPLHHPPTALTPIANTHDYYQTHATTITI